MEASSETRVHHETKERMRGWLMDSATIPRDFQKEGFPQVCQQGDNICQFKWYNDVCSRKTYTIKHWLKGAPEIWDGLHDQRRNGDSIINSLRMNGRPLTSKQ